MSAALAFDAASALPFLQSADAATIDDLPFGVVKMRNSGRVVTYNRYEQELAGLSAEDAIEKDFFTEIAPCTNNFMVRERFVEGWESGESIDEQIDYVFSYKMRKTKVRLRMLTSGDQGWLLVQLR